jgi:hypothetical protein
VAARLKTPARAAVSCVNNIEHAPLSIYSQIERWCMKRILAQFFADVLVLLDPDEDRHSEAGHPVEDTASDLCLGRWPARHTCSLHPNLGSQMLVPPPETRIHMSSPHIPDNNMIEQDYRSVKRLVRPMLGFKSFRSARTTPQGIELMHMIKKSQMVDSQGVSVAAQFYS